MSKKSKVIPHSTRTPISLPTDLEKNLRDFISSIKIYEQETPPSRLDSDLFFGNNHEGYLFLSGEETKAYQKTLIALGLNLCQSELLSEKAVVELFNSAILETLDMNSHRPNLTFEQRLDTAIENFKHALHNGFQEFWIYYPIFGLAESGLPFLMGNVEFGLFGEGYADEVYLSLEKQSTERGKIFVQKVLDDFNKMKLWGKPFSKVISGAYDPKAAQRNALREIRACIDILNFYSDLIPDTKGFIYMPGEADCYQIIIPSIDTREKPKWTISYETAGPIIPVSIELLLKSEANEGLGFSRLRDLVSKPRSEYEDRLLTAVRWAGKATVLTYQDRMEDAFLHYMIALETIIVPEKESEINYQLSIRMAHLMASTATYRKDVAREVRVLYGVRSAIAHSGSFEIKNTDLATIRRLTKNCLVHLLRDEPFSQMKTIDELRNWFEDRIFGIT